MWMLSKWIVGLWWNRLVNSLEAASKIAPEENLDIRLLKCGRAKELYNERVAQLEASGLHEEAEKVPDPGTGPW